MQAIFFDIILNLKGQKLYCSESVTYVINENDAVKCSLLHSDSGTFSGILPCE